jgi:hypothetical protein
MSSWGRDTGAIDSNDVVLGIDSTALFGDNLRVHLNPALPDQGFARPAGSDACLGQNLLEAYAFRSLDH